MSAALHLLQRWRRALHLLLLRRRITQLAGLVEQYEQDICRTHSELGAVQMELARQRGRLRYATAQRLSARQPVTWGL